MTADEHNELKTAESSLKVADSLALQRRFGEAIPIYESVLFTFKQAKASGHADVIYCLQNLADSAALSGHYKKALGYLLELIPMREQLPGVNNADLIGCKYKVAKISELLNDKTKALSMYGDAMSMGEQSLYVGHSLLSAIYAGYLSFLIRVGGNPDLITAIQKKAEANEAARGAVDLADPMRVKDYEGLIWQAPPEPVESEEPKSKFEFPVKAIRNFAIVVVVLAIAGIGGYLALQHHEEKKMKAAQAELQKTYEGAKFESIDGLDRLEFAPGGKVDAIINGVRKTLPLLVLPANSQFSSGGNIGSARSFKEIPDAMLADDGHKLYADGSVEDQIVQRVKIIADAAQKYFDEHKEYPSTSKDLEGVDSAILQNPASKSTDEPSVMPVGKERDWKPEQAPPSVQELQNGLLIPGEPKLAPGAVHCYYFSTGDKYLEGVKRLGFFIRACDSRGHFFPGTKPGTVFMADMIAGRAPIISGIVKPREPNSDDTPLELIKVIPQK